jgi:glycosyltransferase involved in cell wall biosynthesis
MSTVVSIMDRAEWGACTDNIVVADPGERNLLWVPRDLWCAGFGKRINRVYANERHDGLLRALAEHGIAVDHSLCLRREAMERPLGGLSISVPVSERLEFSYPLEPDRPIEEGNSKHITFEPPSERLEGERVHQWIGARFEVDGRRRPFLETGDFARIRRQQVLLRRLLEEGFDFASVLADPQLVSASGPAAREELARVDRSWRFSVLEDVRGVVRDGMMVLEREVTPGVPRPAASVIVLSYNSRARIDTALQSLRAQRLDVPFEVIVVDSGDDGCADYVHSAYPEARVVRSDTRLWPGSARNRGLRVARGDCIAFLSDDSAARPDWLRRRVELHRRGFDLVGGAVVNGTGRSPVGIAGYLLEYSAVLPSERILNEQGIPHSLSYSRECLERTGEFPEDTRTGEDTVFNERALRARATLALDPEIRIANRNLTGFRAYLHHHYVHGRGLLQCVDLHGHRSEAVPRGAGAHRVLAAMFIRYPVMRWSRAFLRIARGRRRSVPTYLALTPIIWVGLWATSVGALSQWRSARKANGRPPPRGAGIDGAQPAISVVVCSYRSRYRIDHALGSLRHQDLDEPWEVIVVDSGDDDAADYVAGTYPEVRIVRSPRRLYPAAARNAGVRAARGPFIAFLPDDGIAEPDWLRRRLERHREGNEAVGGAITNGTPWHPVGTASYFVEYSALLPSDRILRQQEIPHCLSYQRDLVERLGGFPEELETGEDTVLNARLLERAGPIGLDPQIRLAHVNPTSMRAYLRHLYEHGYGFGLARERYGRRARWSRAGEAHAAVRILVWYPLARWWGALGRVARGQPRSLPGYLVLTPLVWAGQWAAALGLWGGWRARSRRAPRPGAPPG